MAFSCELGGISIPLFALILGIVTLVTYLIRLNYLLSCTPKDVLNLTPNRWTKEILLESYRKLQDSPITTSSYANQIPPKLGRRYIVTGGSGESGQNTEGYGGPLT